MQIDRPDLYREVHKGLRNQLFDAVSELGRADLASERGAAAAQARVVALVELLGAHAQHEATHVHPVVQQVDAALHAQVEATHQALDQQLGAVLAQAEALAASPSMAERRAHGVALYLSLSHFVGAYLQHLCDEETEVMPALQQAMSDAELLAVQDRLRASITPEQFGFFLSFMLPAMNVEERTAMLSGMKQGAPPEVFAGVCKLAESVLPAPDWGEVRQRVGL